MDEDILSSLQVVSDLPILRQVREGGDLAQGGYCLGLLDLLEEALLRLVDHPQVEVMKKSILLISYIDECCVEARHHLLDASEIDVSDGEGQVTTLALELYQSLVFQ